MEVCVHQGICHICQRLRKRAEKMRESTHPINRTRWMQMILPLSPGADGMTYANMPTCTGLTVLLWYASVMSSLGTHTGTWT